MSNERSVCLNMIVRNEAHLLRCQRVTPALAMVRAAVLLPRVEQGGSGGVVCGCPMATESCKVLSTGLDAPDPLGG